jgi:hypothetical protein
VLLGAVLFGVGLAVIGYCPGTGMAGSGEGARDAMVGVLGMIAGAGIYVAADNWLEPIALALGDLGKVTVPELLGVPPWAVIVGLAALVAIGLGLVERYEQRGASSGARTGSRLPGGAGPPEREAARDAPSGCHGSSPLSYAFQGPADPVPATPTVPNRERTS